MQKTGRDLPFGTVPGALRLNGKTLCLVYTYFAKISKVPGARAKTWQLGVTIYCTIFNNHLPPPR